jgi:two-component system nitrogen regulation sensor histidine kinase NtrY
VTTREKGTGLGLAIVRKIMEDHNGEIRILDGEGVGAEAVLEFPTAAERIEGDAAAMNYQSDPEANVDG